MQQHFIHITAAEKGLGLRLAQHNTTQHNLLIDVVQDQRRQQELSSELELLFPETGIGNVDLTFGICGEYIRGESYQRKLQLVVDAGSTKYGEELSRVSLVLIVLSGS